MPKRPNISPSQRREWLRRANDGESEQKIAAHTGYTRRAVRDAIQRARMEIDFEAAQREQLREALQSHQRDLLGLIERIERTLYVTPIELESHHNSDFGLEDLQPLDRDAGALDIPLVYSEQNDNSISASQLLAVVRRSASGVEGLEICEEDSMLWKALKQHIGGKDPLWKAFTDWKQATLSEFSARSSLNSVIRKEATEALGLELTAPGTGQPQIYPNLIARVRSNATAKSLGQTHRPISEDLAWDGSTLFYRSSEGLLRADRPDDQILPKITKLVDSLRDTDALLAAHNSHLALKRVVARGHSHAQGYLLLHHVPGRCVICRKLGGR